MNQRLKKHRYITGFDGVRTLAVVAVIMYHLMPYNIQGGYLGVPIFFVLSGYLITDLLNQEWHQNGKIDVWAFYQRRIRRLYPGLVTMVVATAAYITLFQRNLLFNLRAVVVTNFLYVYNWLQVHQGQSYFDRFGTQSPFVHLWSLSIEGQFYLFWPLILLFLWVVVRRRQPIFDIIFIGAFLSALAMALLFRHGQDPSRIYFGTDTRIFSILLGASLSIVWPSASLKKDLQNSARFFLDGVGIAALLLIIWMFFQLPGESDLNYRGGMFFFSLLSVMLIAAVAHPGADLNRLLSNRLFSWLGKRSYGIYLYQYPVMIFYEAKVTNIAQHPWLHALIEIAIIVLVSHLSYTYIERPLQHFDYHRTKEVLREFVKRDSRYGVKRIWVVLAAVVCLTAAVGSFSTQAAQTKAKVSNLQAKIDANEQAVKKHNQAVEGNSKNKNQADSAATISSSTSSASSAASSSTAADGAEKLTADEQQKATTLQITAVGDSVLADGSVSLQQVFPKMYVDAKVGRQAKDAIGVLQGLAQQGKLAPTVLLSLGTNGPFSDDQLQQIMQIIGKQRKVFWVNTHVPTRRWQDQVNQALNSAQSRYSNLKVIDWYAYSKQHSDWFYSDNVHPNEYGLKFYSSFVAKKILQGE
ncbi:MAG: acyltransferase family protein [Liquorilactobacillus ghanensis]|jgi:peptidoglycan/LPS O-acetylase OafA/YrhL|uniref:Acyltransferase n=1 Tax=Liquorilactobacillus ghanensis DSM 18630 TaxID=1423750 RepID=A0A0R1VX49_9LACO|nr:acyltransferase family protein [Liquorilactobacillus ghanensis]KRM07609.1 acyltransferase [Liquorilactobacillus ghanensis DSM 18630]